MKSRLLHIFRNSPMGRENLMQSAYFCDKQFGLSLSVYVPMSTQFIMHFEAGSVPVDLDSSYVQYPETAQTHAEEILARFKCDHDFYTPTEYASGNLPVIPTEWAMLTCPRVISDRSSRIGLGHIGPKVRSLVKHAPFPVFIPSMSFKPWTSVAIFFGGSPLGVTAVREGIAIARLARMPFTVLSQLTGVTREQCERALAEARLLSHLHGQDGGWQAFDQGSFEENLYAVPHDSLVVVGAAGHKLMVELVFGSKLEIIQATLPNPLVVVGPNCQTPWELLPGAAAG
jgi:hypothetical protein